MYYSFKRYLVLVALLIASTPFANASTSIRGAEEEIESPLGAGNPKKKHKAHHHSPPIKTKTLKEKISQEETHGDHRDLETFQSRIVGGEDAPSGEYPFMVNWDKACGGSLIAPNVVLTAAHCQSINGGVRIGSDRLNGGIFNGGDTRAVIRKCPHPNYNSFGTTKYDFLLLELNESVDYDVIKLNQDENQPQDNEMLTVIGWGTTSQGGSQSNQLQQVSVPTLSPQDCQSQYPGVNKDIHLCAGFTQGGKDSCQGDSGGPIFEFDSSGEPIQVGVVSFGNGCARPNNAGVYARVSGVSDWIQTTMQSLVDGNGCNGGGGGGGGGGGSCFNDPVGWHDSDGSFYDCAWYSQNNNCNSYGGQFANFGKTASEACCVCGGGKDDNNPSPPTPPPPTPRPPTPPPPTPGPPTPPPPTPPPPTPGPPTPPPPTPSPPTPAPPTQAPPTGPTGNGCQSTPGWYDAEGEGYDCQWYAEGNNCASYGNQFEAFGETANEACCECGGGSTAGGGGDSGCSNFPSNWEDSAGDSCDWYNSGIRCWLYGWQYTNNGKNAWDACCVCGGGA